MADAQLTRWMLPLLLSAAALLAGCDEPGVKEAAAAEVALRAALNEVKAIKDPWDAFKLLDLRETAALTSNNPCYRGTCKEVPAWEISTKERIRLLGLAVDQNRVEALSYLYANGFTTSDEYTPLRRASVPKLFAYADKAQGKAEDRPLLMLAGRLVADGNETMLDTSRAVGYYARAWAAGEPTAANAAATLFLRINDQRNAYLWSLRCTGDCQRDTSIALTTLQATLTPEAAKQAQRVAATPSVVELDTTGG
jgi:hypothetical protein